MNRLRTENPHHRWIALTLVAAIGLGAPVASAGLLDKAKSGLKKVGDKVKGGAKKAGNTVKGGVKKVGTTVKKGATDAWQKVKDGVTGGAKKVKDVGEAAVSVAFKGTQGLSAIFSAEQMNKLKDKLTDVVKRGQRELSKKLESALESAKTFAKDVVNNIKTAGVWQKAKEAYNAFRGTVDPMVALVKKLVNDAATKLKLQKLVANAVDGKFTAEDRETAEWFGKQIRKEQHAQWESRRQALGFCAEKPKIKSFQLTFGLAISAISPKIVGGMVEGRWGIVADFDKQPGKVLDLRAYWHIAGGVGGGVPGVDVAGNIMCTVSPMPAANAPGAFFGLFAEAGAGLGVEVEIEWGFADGVLYPWPSFGFALGAQDPQPGGAVMLSGGYAFTINEKGTQY